MNETDALYKFGAKWPAIPDGSSKDFARHLIQEFALENNFVVITEKTDGDRFWFKCKKGGQYCSTRGLTEKTRKRSTTSGKTGCPFKIRYKVSHDFVCVQKPQSDIQMHHNHAITVETLCATPEGRMSKLTPENINTMQEGFRNKIPTKVIQRTISEGKSYNALYSHDIANMKAKQARKEARPFRNSDGMVLVETMKSRGYNVIYRRSSEDYISGIFFATDSMLTRARRFNEVYIIDATYDTNNLKMPLISVYGVSNIGERLMTFAVAFAWVSNETEITYKWFLETLNQKLNIPATTVFVTDKCQAMINQLNA